MHACGHDAHTAILMGVASVLAGMRADIPGTVSFIFQPAEEGAPEGEEGGAKLMLAQGVLKTAANPSAIFGLHVWPVEAGAILYRPRGAMAAADELKIVVTGKQTHGSSPWRGVDPIIVAAQIMTALQAIPSRQLDITKAPAVITIGSIHGGVRGNIIPDTVEMIGTIRNFDDGVRKELLTRLERTATAIASAAGAEATVTINPYSGVTWNDPELDRAHAAFAAARRGKGGGGPDRDGSGGLFLVPAADSRPVRDARCEHARGEPRPGGTESFAAVRGERIRAENRCAHAVDAGAGLPAAASPMIRAAGGHRRSA